jgi:meso-butanediol dehydrogenase/(S,S)-butanediol dehydrogenase/diacetyl reductase
MLRFARFRSPSFTFFRIVAKPARNGKARGRHKVVSESIGGWLTATAIICGLPPSIETMLRHGHKISQKGSRRSFEPRLHKGAEMGKLENRIAVITGAGSGIGAATARLFAAEGARVVIADIDESGGQKVAAELGAAGAFCKTDVRNPSQVEALVKFTVDRFGRLDVIHNNAFYTTVGAVGEMSIDGWLKTISVTLSGVFYGMRFALPQMLAQGGGAIVNTASISGLFGDYRMGAYNAAKAGVVNLTKTAAIEYARKNIRVNAVCPGMIATPPVVSMLGATRDPDRTNKNAAESHPIGRLGQPEEIAKVVLFLASDDASFMTGSIVVADGGATAHTGLLGHPL